jgi:hypothetical protein
MKKAYFYRQFANELGQEAEQEVHDALCWMRGQGEIQDFYQTPKNSRQDTRGIDFVVFSTRHWLPIVLQVKRSFGQIQAHRKKYPDIPVVIVRQGNLMRQIRNILNQKLIARKQKRQTQSMDVSGFHHDAGSGEDL